MKYTATPVLVLERAPDDALGIVENELQALGRRVAQHLENEFTTSVDFHGLGIPKRGSLGSGSGIAFRLNWNASSRHFGATSSVGAFSISTPD